MRGLIGQREEDIHCEPAGRNSLCAGESVKGTAGETGRKQDRNKD